MALKYVSTINSLFSKTNYIKLNLFAAVSMYQYLQKWRKAKIFSKVLFLFVKNKHSNVCLPKCLVYNPRETLFCKKKHFNFHECVDKIRYWVFGL